MSDVLLQHVRPILPPTLGPSNLTPEDQARLIDLAVAHRVPGRFHARSNERNVLRSADSTDRLATERQRANAMHLITARSMQRVAEVLDGNAVECEGLGRRCALRFARPPHIARHIARAAADAVVELNRSLPDVMGDDLVVSVPFLHRSDGSSMLRMWPFAHRRRAAESVMSVGALVRLARRKFESFKWE